MFCHDVFYDMLIFPPSEFGGKKKEGEVRDAIKIQQVTQEANKWKREVRPLSFEGNYLYGGLRESSGWLYLLFPGGVGTWHMGTRGFTYPGVRVPDVWIRVNLWILERLYYAMWVTGYFCFPRRQFLAYGWVLCSGYWWCHGPWSCSTWHTFEYQEVLHPWGEDEWRVSTRR